MHHSSAVCLGMQQHSLTVSGTAALPVCNSRPYHVRKRCRVSLQCTAKVTRHANISMHCLHPGMVVLQRWCLRLHLMSSVSQIMRSGTIVVPLVALDQISSTTIAHVTLQVVSIRSTNTVNLLNNTTGISCPLLLLTWPCGHVLSHVFAILCPGGSC